MALLWTSSLGWLAALGVRPLAFKRTLKQQTVRRGSLSFDTIISSVALAAGLVLLSHHAEISGLVLIVSASGLLTAPFVDGSLRRAAAEAAAL